MILFKIALLACKIVGSNRLLKMLSSLLVMIKKILSTQSIKLTPIFRACDSRMHALSLILLKILVNSILCHSSMHERWIN
jgi:hypothetical protein